MPQGSNALLGMMLSRAGVEVVYSAEADNDDTIASHAQADGAAILSQDKDMFRYNGRKYTVYSEFAVTEGQLLLREHPLHSTGVSTYIFNIIDL